VPIDELPPGERLPAAPFLVVAYSVAWVVIVGFLWSIRQRLLRVDREIAEAMRRVPPESPPPRRGGG
jgi:CcmD family protein